MSLKITKQFRSLSKRQSKSPRSESPVQRSSVTAKPPETSHDGFSPLNMSDGRCEKPSIENPQPLKKDSSGMSTIWGGKQLYDFSKTLKNDCKQILNRTVLAVGDCAYGTKNKFSNKLSVNDSITKLEGKNAFTAGNGTSLDTIEERTRSFNDIDKKTKTARKNYKPNKTRVLTSANAENRLDAFLNSKLSKRSSTDSLAATISSQGSNAGEALQGLASYNANLAKSGFNLPINKPPYGKVLRRMASFHPSRPYNIDKALPALPPDADSGASPFSSASNSPTLSTRSTNNPVSLTSAVTKPAKPNPDINKALPVLPPEGGFDGRNNSNPGASPICSPSSSTESLELNDSGYVSAENLGNLEEPQIMTVEKTVPYGKTNNININFESGEMPTSMVKAEPIVHNTANGTKPRIISIELQPSKKSM